MEGWLWKSSPNQTAITEIILRHFEVYDNMRYRNKWKVILKIKRNNKKGVK